MYKCLREGEHGLREYNVQTSWDVSGEVDIFETTSGSSRVLSSFGRLGFRLTSYFAVHDRAA